MKKLLFLLLITPALGFSQFNFLPFEIDGVVKIYDDFYIVPEGKILVLYGDNLKSFRFKDNLGDYEIYSSSENFYVPPNCAVKPYSQNALRGILYDWNETTFLKDIKCFNKIFNGDDFSYTVPNGIISYVQFFSGDVFEGTDNQGEPQKLNRGDFLFQGDMVSSGEQGRLIIVEYSVSEFKNSVLSYNAPKNKLITPTLYPNPTSSLLALNRDKEYHIEVFDLNGRKIMEVEGNNLDMSNLSKATYIVKAFDKASKETYSYKVVRN